MMARFDTASQGDTCGVCERPLAGLIAIVEHRDGTSTKTCVDLRCEMTADRLKQPEPEPKPVKRRRKK